MTLPLIFALNQSGYFEKKSIINIVKNHSEEPKEVKKVIDFVHEKGGIQYAEKVMHEYKNKALQELHKIQDSASRQSLEQLLIYTIQRKK